MSIIARNFSPILVVTLLLYGALNHVICLFLLRFLFALWVFVFSCGALNSNLWLHPLFLSASRYGCAALLNIALFDEIADRSFVDVFWYVFDDVWWVVAVPVYI